MNRIRLRGLSALVAALVVGSALTGCATAQQAGAAAIVDGDRISVARLQSLTENLEAAGAAVDPQTREPLPAGEAQRRTLEKLIASRVLAKAADEMGIVVTQGDVDQRYAEFVDVAGGDAAVQQGLALARNVPPAYARQYVRDLVTSERLARQLVPGSDDDPAVQNQRQQALNDLLIKVGAEMDVEVNPRYGAWQADSGSIAALVSGGLSQPAGQVGAAAAPTPSETPTGSR